MNWSPISNSMKEWLVRLFEEEEIKEGIFGCEGDKTLSLDGFVANFFQKSWDIIKADILKVF